MANEYSTRRYRNWYAKLLRLYPKPYRERFGEGMEQTFNDLCRERKKAGEGLFAFVGTLLVGSGLTIELATRKTGNFSYPAAVAIAVVTASILVGGNAAVGIIGTEDEFVNLMYLGVLGVGFIGALIARFKPHGMSRVMFAMALALMLIAVVALITGMHQFPGSSVLEILIANGFFAALFVGSALLFRKAARKQAAA